MRAEEQQLYGEPQPAADGGVGENGAGPAAKDAGLRAARSSSFALLTPAAAVVDHSHIRVDSVIVEHTRWSCEQVRERRARRARCVATVRPGHGARLAAPGRALDVINGIPWHLGELALARLIWRQSALRMEIREIS
eukprot:COSAG01_NODE_7816_length_3045_cov_6.803802_4_plen_137_part_00